MEGHGKLIEACIEIENLSEHAAARGYSHPGIQQFQLWMRSRPPAPHAQRFQAAVSVFGGLDVTNDYLVEIWKREVDPVIEDMKSCQLKLWAALREKDTREFVTIERELVAREKAELEKAMRDGEEGHVDPESSWAAKKGHSI